MEELNFYISELTPAQRNYLLRHFSHQPALAPRLLCIVLKKNCGKKEIMSLLKVSSAMFNKISTQAKQELLEELKKFAENPFDEIYFLRSLVLKGAFTPARKLFFYLEKHFMARQKWQHLELLYVEGLRLCQATGNLKLARQTTLKRKQNANYLIRFIDLSTELNTLLFEFEVYEQKKLPPSFLQQTKKILKKVRSLGHYTLIHNTLQLEYLYFSRYTDKSAEAKKLAAEIYKNRLQHYNRMDEITSVLALNVYANYITIYEGEFTSTFINEVLRQIAAAGKHAVFNFYYILLDYYLYNSEFGQLEKQLKEIAHLEDNTKFTLYLSGILAIKAFGENDTISFKSHIRHFYNDPNRLDFPEVECFLRILEAFRLIADNKEEDALYKLNALRVFMDRNLSTRYIFEKRIVSFLIRLIKSSVKESEKHAFMESLEGSPYRNIRFLASLKTCRAVMDK
jgi:hypothetical protein